ncbi:MAG: hypothetical protein M1838_000529 [Thelocarpon superellum]|nr:MAG: hypothetical protein M1838_000529 [Thelocarpon superellum]
MLLGTLSFPRLCYSVAVYLTILYLFILCPAFPATPSSLVVSYGYGVVAPFRTASGIPDPMIKQQAGTARRELEETIEPVEFFNLPDLAERMKAFIKLATATQIEPLLDAGPLENLLRWQFPWLDATKLKYTPWTRRHPAQQAEGTDAETTGIVISVGDNNVLVAGHLIRTLRHVLKSTLPIELAFYGDKDLSQEGQESLMALTENITPLDVSKVFPDPDLRLDKGCALKPFSLLASRFQRVILVDADVIFMRNPDEVFETQPGLVETGTLFWHDRAIDFLTDSIRDWLQPVMGDRKPSAMLQQSLMWKENARMEMESGVVCMDKGRPGIFLSAVLAAWMNSGDIRPDPYDQVWGTSSSFPASCTPSLHTNIATGDKETYWIATELTSTPYHFQSEYAGTIGTPSSARSICGAQAAHTDSTGALFWLSNSLRRDQYISRELGVFTHWQHGMVSFPGNGSWTRHDEPRWCLDGAAPVPLSESGMDSVMEALLREARRVDHAFDVAGWKEDFQPR